MMIFVIAGIAGLILFALLLVVVLRARSGKEENTREYYAFKCIALLIGLAGDAIATIMAPSSVWDFLAALFHVRSQDSELIALISRILIVFIFLLCWLLVYKTYAHWNGPVSRRQHQRDTQEMESGSMLEDFLLVASGGVKRDFDLKVYRPAADFEEYQENEITKELPWHIEFAKIYMLMSNQAHIDVKQDWHSQEHCFISSYSAEHKIAIYCSSRVPSDEQVEAYIAYIHQLHKTYFRIVVAIKEGGGKDYVRSVGGEQIEYIFKENALDRLVDFSEYFRAVEALYNQPLMGSTQFTIEDVYVEPVCAEGMNGADHKLNGYVEEWLKEDGNRQLALLGDFGQGKTLYSIYLTYHMIRSQSERIPILIPLRNKSPRNSNQAEILSYFAVQYGISAEALLLLNANGRLLLLFDGFDEMDLIGNDDIRKRHFKSLWSLVMPKSKVLITGRPNYFLDPQEMKSALGLRAGTEELPYCQELFLQPFNQDQILEALRNAKESVQKGIQYILQNNISRSFLDLISRPSHLFLVSLIWEERELEKKYHNLSSATIINEFLQNSFERQAAKGGSAPYFYLSPAEREYYMTGIAVKMYKMGETAITYESFNDAIVDLTDMFPEQLSLENPVFMDLRNGKSVSDFAQEDINSMRAIMNDVRTCGILVNDYVNNGLAFAHKSFFDLLVAKFYMGKVLRLHDSSMIISDTLSSVSAYNLKSRGDFAVRKLLAELIASRITMNMKSTSESIRCKKMFEQCQKTIMHFPIRFSPQRLFDMCLKKHKRMRPIGYHERRSLREARRLSMVFLMAPLMMVLYLGRGIQLTMQYREEALKFYRMIRLTKGAAVGGSLTASYKIIAFVFLGVFVGWLAACRVGEIMMVSFRNKADIVLLTWYYTCLENHVSYRTLSKYFSQEDWHVFLKYAEGRNLEKVLNEF